MQDLENLFHQEVTIELFESRSSYGVISYQDPFTCLCRISGEEKEFRDNKGRELVSQVRVTILGDVPNLDGRARVTLPQGYTPKQPPIISVGRYRDMDGNISHTSIYF